MASASFWAALIRRDHSKSSSSIIPSQKHLFQDYQIRDIKETFPDDDIELAIQKYSRLHGFIGIMFMDPESIRCTWGVDVEYYQTHKWRQWTQQLKDGNRHYNVLRKRPTLAQIDQPKPRCLHQLVAHCSKFQWNLPTSHRRHLLNIATEILDIILGFALTVSDSASLQPSTTVSNWKSEPRDPGYSLRNNPWLQSLYGVGRGQFIRIGHNETSEDYRNVTFARVQKFDNRGQFIEIRRVRRAPIDASFLRASKKLYLIGRPILYGKNPFIFAMTNPSSCFCPPTAILKAEYQDGTSNDKKLRNTSLAMKYSELELNPWKPFRYDTMSAGDEKIRQGISAIQRQLPLIELPGWLYHDTFLRFLHTIGPKNSSSLETLKFNGTLQVHSCDSTICKRCPDDLLTSLRLYIPFIKAICKSVKKIIIYVEKDYLYKFDPEEDGFVNVNRNLFKLVHASLTIITNLGLQEKTYVNLI